jgi:hypothetical protein
MILSIHLNRGGKKCFAFKERSRLERCSPYWPDVNEKEEEEEKKKLHTECGTEIVDIPLV